MLELLLEVGAENTRLYPRRLGFCVHVKYTIKMLEVDSYDAAIMLVAGRVHAADNA